MTCPTCRRSLAAHIVEMVGRSGRVVVTPSRAITYQLRCDLPAVPLSNPHRWGQHWLNPDCSTIARGTPWCSCFPKVVYPPTPDGWWTNGDVAEMFHDLTHPLEAVPA